MMVINILTLFSNYFQSCFQQSIIQRAIKSGQVEINVLNIRDFATDKHQLTDDRPYGGGPGMVMMVEPIYRALASLDLIERDSSHQVILCSAKGDLYQQQTAATYSRLKSLTIICGHYQGVDQRVRSYIDREVRIGNYVLTGGEPAALVVCDSVIRLLPEVLGNTQSLENESHSAAVFKSHPLYTKPRIFLEQPVPPVLLSGNHQLIAKWKEKHTTTQD